MVAALFQALHDSPPAGQLQATLQDIYSSIEQYWEGGVNSIGPAHLFFQLLDDVRDTLPVSSVISSDYTYLQTGLEQYT